MSDHKIRRTIKRLYRLANRATGAEADNALRRAQELSMKHGITVDPNEPEESRVPVHLTSAYWHQVLLMAICRAYDCRVLRKRTTKEVVIVGEGNTPAEAEQKFKNITGELWGSCTHQWLSWRVRQIEDVAELEPLFRKAFLNTAAETAARELLPGGTMRAPVPADLPQMQQVNLYEQVLAAERKEMNEMVQEARSHYALAQEALRRGAESGKVSVHQCDWSIKAGALQATSTIAPPPPGGYLDRD